MFNCLLSCLLERLHNLLKCFFFQSTIERIEDIQGPEKHNTVIEKRQGDQRIKVEDKKQNGDDIFLSLSQLKMS